MIQFEEMGIAPQIMEAIRELGFENPMPVQEKVIPLLLDHATDIIGLAQTGTGKTAAFGLPLVQLTNVESRHTQALVLAPTRELCMQITNDLKSYAKYTSGLSILAVYGGASIDTQIRELRKGVQIIVATPGRLIDLMERKVAKLSAVSTVVLDEADEMLNMGFLDSINEILAGIPAERQTLLFSATMPAAIASIANKYMKKPVEITIGIKNSGAENVNHAYYLIHAKDKYQVLKRIADFEPDIYGIIFCRTRKETQEIATKLINDGYSADSLHGDLSQQQRDAVMQKFRIRNIQLLVATDVAARGLDVNDLTHVIHYSLPDDAEVYTHRSGRTGRAGKTGTSLLLVHLREKHMLQQIERKLKKNIIPAKVPTGHEICGKQLFHWVDKLEKVNPDHEQIEAWLPQIYAKLEGIDREELINRIVSLEFETFLNDYKHAPDVQTENTINKKEKGQDRGNNRQAEEGYARLFINLGKMDGLYPAQLIDLINKNTPGKKIQLGKIDLMKHFSFFEVESSRACQLIESLSRARFQDRKIVVQPAQEKSEDDPTASYERKEPAWDDYPKKRKKKRRERV